MEAKVKGDTQRAEQYFNMYKTLKASTTSADQHPKGKQARSPETGGEEEQLPPNSPTAKAEEESDDELVVGELKFTAGALPKHDKMGFTPYFDKNIR
jgi:hypothetical protein